MVKDKIWEYPEFKSLNLTNEEKQKWLPIAKQIYEDNEKCAKLGQDKCFNSSFIHSCLERDEYTNKIVIRTRVCPKAKLVQNYLVRQFSANKLALSLLNNKQDVVISDPREEQINKILKDSIKQNKIIGFCLQGTVGIGKSYKIISYCNDMIMKNDAKVAYCFLPSLVREMKDNFSLDSTANKKIVDDCCEADILVLDDFGAEITNSWFYLSVLLVILNYRSENDMPVIVISNFKMKKLIELLKKNVASKDGKLDAETQEVMVSRLIDRLAQLVDNTEYSYSATSRRLSKK